MKKFVALFTDSYRELKSVRTITTMAMLAAIALFLACSPSNTAILSASVFRVSRTESLLPVWTDGWRHFFRNA